jgi:SWIM zinc finger
MERMRQGLELAQRGAVSLPDDGQDLSAVVRSGSNLYQIDTRLLTCTCADYQKHLQACKHLLAVEVHIGALGLASPAPEKATAADTAAVEEVVKPATVPSTATWPISEAPASLNIQLKVGNMQIMYTMRDVNDLKLQRRATMALPWLQDIMVSCEANLAARQQVEEERKVQARSLEEQIAAAAQAAIQAQTPPTSPNGQRQPPPRDPMLAPTNDTDPSWCPIHRCKMERRSNERGSWYSHRLGGGVYCKGE